MKKIILNKSVKYICYLLLLQYIIFLFIDSIYNEVSFLLALNAFLLLIAPILGIYEITDAKVKFKK